MGKYLDTFSFSLSSFLIMFTLLSFTEKDIRLIGVLSAVTAFLVGVIVHWVLKRTPILKFRRRRNESEKKIKALIYMDENDALNSVYGLLSQKYRLKDSILNAGCMLFKEGEHETRYALVVIRKFKVSPDDILSKWREIKKNMSLEKIVFAIPGKSDPDVKLMPIKLASPDVMILDKIRLKKLLRKYDFEITTHALRKRIKFKQRVKAFISRKRAVRYIAYALLLTVNYILFGSILYLIFASLLGFAGVFSFLSENESEFLSD
ncbi:MAG: hypothetical protein IKJ65_06990 [Clostridia bacterium]|nr:hypothetical protein [Clostridia bacterium]